MNQSEHENSQSKIVFAFIPGLNLFFSPGIFYFKIELQILISKLIFEYSTNPVKKI
jgi:hypothetical protein